MDNRISDSNVAYLELDESKMVSRPVTKLKPSIQDKNVLQEIVEHATTVIHVLTFGLTAFVIYLCFQDDSFNSRTWHALLYTIGWFVLSSEGILFITKDNIASKRVTSRWRTRGHWIIITLGVSLAIAGFIIIFTHKTKHFASVHAITGLISGILGCLTCLSGIPTLFSAELRKKIPPNYSKLFHAVVGSAAVILGATALITAFYKKWFLSKVDYNAVVKKREKMDSSISTISFPKNDFQLQQNGKILSSKPSINLLQDVVEHITTVIHVLNVCLTIYVLYLCFLSPFSLVTWHVFLYTLGWTLLMSEGILALIKENIFTKHIQQPNRVRIHWATLLLATQLIIGGLGTIVWNRSRVIGSHFLTEHGISGIVATICGFVAVLNGIPTLYSVQLRRFISPNLNKLFHAFIGFATVVAGAYATITGYYTGWRAIPDRFHTGED
ncbi:hypothetical protein Trydic_g1478 [Trypoxylus dichotomus]